MQNFSNFYQAEALQRIQEKIKGNTFSRTRGLAAFTCIAASKSRFQDKPSWMTCFAEYQVSFCEVHTINFFLLLCVGWVCLNLSLLYSACWMWLHTTIIFWNVWFYSSVCSTLYHTNYKLLITSNWVNSLDPFFLLQQFRVTQCQKRL